MGASVRTDMMTPTGQKLMAYYPSDFIGHEL